jgi:hypothetical protein
MTVGSTICMVVESDKLWEEILVPSLIGAVGGAAPLSKPFRQALVEPAIATVAIVQLARMVGGMSEPR